MPPAELLQWTPAAMAVVGSGALPLQVLWVFGRGRFEQMVGVVVVQVVRDEGWDVHEVERASRFGGCRVGQ